MLEPNAIHTTRELDAGGATCIRAQLRMVRQVMAFADRADIDREEQRCKQEIWRSLYGDIERKIQEIRYRVLSSCMPTFTGDADNALNELATMVRDPFARTHTDSINNS